MNRLGCVCVLVIKNVMVGGTPWLAESYPRRGLHWVDLSMTYIQVCSVETDVHSFGVFKDLVMKRWG